MEFAATTASAILSVLFPPIVWLPGSDARLSDLSHPGFSCHVRSVYVVTLDLFYVEDNEVQVDGHLKSER